MTREQEDYEDALKTMKGINKTVMSLNWHSKNLDRALDGVYTLLGVVNDQANAGVSEIDWDLNALIDSLFSNGRSKKSITNHLKKIEDYLKRQLND